MIHRRCRFERWRRGGHPIDEQLAGASDESGALCVGEEPDMADAVEAVGQHVDQEPPHELSRAQRHGAIAISPGLAVVLDPERDALAVECGDAAVGDGDAVGVAGQIGEHVVGAGERLLGVDDPVPLALLLKVGGERGLIGQPSVAPKN
jgi:hypothetical protein